MNSKQSVKKIFILVAGIFLVVASRSGNFAAVPFAYAQEDCSLATLNGEYLVTGTVQARIDQRDDPTLPRIVVAVWTFDGKGNFTTHAIQNFGGDYREVDQIGTYAVEPGRCVATMTFPLRWALLSSGARSHGTVERPMSSGWIQMKQGE
jgi:hypothetical protein